MISSIDNGFKESDVFSKQENMPKTIPLARETVNRLIADAPSSTTQLSKEAIDKNLKEVIQIRNSTIEKNRSTTNGITNDIDTWFSALQSHSSLSKTDMSGLISDALHSYTGSGNSTTLSMDLAVTQGMLNKLVERFVPADQQAESYREVEKFVSDKASAQDAVLQDLTQRSLDIARQYGDTAGVTQFEQQLDSISHGEHATQKERDAMLSITDTTASSAGWLSAFTQLVHNSGDNDFFKRISYDHISQLATRIEQFNNKANHFDAGFSLTQ